MKPNPKPERALVRARRCGGDAQAATLWLRRFMIPGGMINTKPSHDQVREARLAALQKLGDAAALQGTQALNDWWDGLCGDDIAILTIAIDNVWKQTAATVDRQRRDP